MSRNSFIPFDPQPDPTSVVVVKRKYSVLARNPNYKKRVTWFECDPAITKAVVEYIGEYTPNVVHGNAKTTTAPYRQLTSQQKTIIRQGLQHGKAPREIRRDVNQQTPENMIDHRITQNAKYHQQKRYESLNTITHLNATTIGKYRNCQILCKCSVSLNKTNCVMFLAQFTTLASIAFFSGLHTESLS